MHSVSDILQHVFLGSRLIFSLNQAVQPLVGSSRLFVHPPYLEAVSSIRNLGTRHDVVTRDPTYYGNSN
jgi:hypothetical protein